MAILINISVFIIKIILVIIKFIIIIKDRPKVAFHHYYCYYFECYFINLSQIRPISETFTHRIFWKGFLLLSSDP